MNIKENTINILEESNMRVHIGENGGVELETWTNGGVNMFITLVDIKTDEDILRGLKEYKNNFSVDEEVMLYLQDKSYKEDFTIRESLEDFEDYLNHLDLLIFKLSKPKTYTVPVVYESWGTVEVEAKDRDDLLMKLKDNDFVDGMSLPIEPEYVDDSYEIDFDSLE